MSLKEFGFGVHFPGMGGLHHAKVGHFSSTTGFYRLYFWSYLLYKAACTGGIGLILNHFVKRPRESHFQGLSTPHFFSSSKSEPKTLFHTISLFSPSILFSIHVALCTLFVPSSWTTPQHCSPYTLSRLLHHQQSSLMAQRGRIQSL